MKRYEIDVVFKTGATACVTYHAKDRADAIDFVKRAYKARLKQVTGARQVKDEPQEKAA